MNLKNETDQVLIGKTVKLVRQEREVLTAILHHLREIDRRRAYASLQYKSLHDFTVRHLGYPDDQAFRRIDAMKLLHELPEVEEKINAGDLSLTHLGIAQRHFRDEEKATSESLSREQKMEVLNRIADKPVREAERITLALSSAPAELKPDRFRTVSAERIELKFTAARATKQKIDTLKGLLAHKHPNLSLGDLVEMLCDLGIESWDPSKIPAAPRKRRVVQPAEVKHAVQAIAEDSTLQPQAEPAPTKKKSAAQIRRDVFAKAKNACENCGSTFALEVDHVQPRARGGSSEAENLRLLCRSCNQREAIRVFGVETMDGYLN